MDSRVVVSICAATRTAFPDTVDGYDSESVDNWEIGLKTTSGWTAT